MSGLVSSGIDKDSVGKSVYTNPVKYVSGKDYIAEKQWLLSHLVKKRKSFSNSLRRALDMAPLLYMLSASPPCTAVIMTAKSIGLDLELKEIDLLKGEHKTPEYLKMNPQHTVPTLVDDDGFTIWDSHAIMPYLISKYGEDDSLYPRDPQKRAIVDQRLHFESGIVYAMELKILRPIIYQGKKTVDQEDKNATDVIYGFLEVFLEDNDWMTGDSVTIADYSLLASVSSFDVLYPIDRERFPKLVAWLERAETLPVYYVYKRGLEAFDGFLKFLLGEQ